MSQISQKTFPPSAQTELKRKPTRGHYDAATIYAILDSALYANVGFVLDAQPQIIPTAIWRENDALYIHGSNGSRMLKHLARGAPATVCATLLDGIVLARSAFHGSINYRSVCLYGHFTALAEAAEKNRQMQIFYDSLVPGRWSDMRPPTAHELAAMTVLVMPITEAVAKIRSGPPIDDAEDLALPHWAGVLPIQSTRGQPQAAPEINSAELPAYLRAWAHKTTS